MFDKLLARLRGATMSDVTADPAGAAGPLRWVVLDTETTGLSLWHDHLISIAAVAVVCEPGLTAPRIVLGDRFETIIRQDRPTQKKSNILIHHIGVEAQKDGQDAGQALQRFVRWVGDAPLLAFHAPFDKAMVAKALKQNGLPALANPWLDVAVLASIVRRDTYAASLDDRLQQFGLQCFERHEAAADMFATAELLLRLLPALRQQVQDFRGLARLCSEQTRAASG